MHFGRNVDGEARDLAVLRVGRPEERIGPSRIEDRAQIGDFGGERPALGDSRIVGAAHHQIQGLRIRRNDGRGGRDGQNQRAQREDERSATQDPNRQARRADCSRVKRS